MLVMLALLCGLLVIPGVVAEHREKFQSRLAATPSDAEEDTMATWSNLASPSDLASASNADEIAKMSNQEIYERYLAYADGEEEVLCFFLEHLTRSQLQYIYDQLVILEDEDSDLLEQFLGYLTEEQIQMLTELEHDSIYTGKTDELEDDMLYSLFLEFSSGENADASALQDLLSELSADRLYMLYSRAVEDGERESAGEMPSLLADSQILELFPFIANGEETEVSEFLDQLDENQIHELFLGLVEETEEETKAISETDASEIDEESDFEDGETAESVEDASQPMASVSRHNCPVVAASQAEYTRELIRGLNQEQVQAEYETLLQEADESHTRLFVQYLSDDQVLKLYQDLCDTEDEAAAELAAQTLLSYLTEEQKAALEENLVKPAAEEMPYNLSVTFAGETLKESTDSEKNVFTDSWTSDTAKNLDIVLTKNSDFTDQGTENFDYILSMKVKDIFYFGGIPTDSTTGIDAVAFIKNEDIIVQNYAGETVQLLNPASGEIRIQINPAVDRIDLHNTIQYKVELAGYTGNTLQAITDILEVKLERIATASDQSDTLSDYKVDQVNLKTGTLNGSGLNATFSADGYATVNSVVNQAGVNVSKSGTFSYSGGLAGPAVQLYKTLQVKYYCPYIEYNGNTYYLKFSAEDTAFTGNQQGIKKGPKAKSVVYTKEDHSITYTFENLYIGSHNALFYTPQFFWPDDEAVKNLKLSQDGIEIKWKDWEITEQTSYTGYATTLTSTYKKDEKRKVYFMEDQVDIQIKSSDGAADSDQIAKRHIYKDVCRENGYYGSIGFFDIHNDGVVDSGLLNVKFVFNTGKNQTAKYYVTKVALPVYDNASGTEVTYVLVSDENEGTVSGTYSYSDKSSFACGVEELRKQSNVSDHYYIKSLSYQTKMKKSTRYHRETAHLWRNRQTSDSGLFFGYLEGETGGTAQANLTVSSVDEKTAIRKDGKKEITVTEQSTVSDTDDYVARSIDKLVINESSSTVSVTAGASPTLKFGEVISSEEYYGAKLSDAKRIVNFVNGYHVFRDGIFYLCLPEGVSIRDKEDVTIALSDKLQSRTISAKSVDKLVGTECTIDGITACWWRIQANGMNVYSNDKLSGSYTVSVKLTTSSTIKNPISWNFQNKLVIESSGQLISWGAAGTKNSTANGAGELAGKTKAVQIQKLAEYFKSETGAVSKRGFNLYNAYESNTTTLNVMRLEAKLDVESKLSLDDKDYEAEIALDKPERVINYHVTVSSKDGGVANNFAYYIPIPKTCFGVDEDTLVFKKEFNLKLISVAESGSNTENSPFQIYGTKAEGLTSGNVNDKNVVWTAIEPTTDLSTVTMLKITMKTDAKINEQESRTFQLKLQYDNGANDFSKNTGMEVEWRSFGKYTYTRDGVTTTNTYPLRTSNKICLLYSEELSGATDIELNTGAAENQASADTLFAHAFAKDQVVWIKSVKASDGTQLLSASENPAGKTGADANQQFRVSFAMKTHPEEGTGSTIGESTVLTTGTTDGTAQRQSWTIPENTPVGFQTTVEFSKALTDTTTERYAIITLGNENLDITYRVNLVRRVAEVTATGSGVAVGEHYKVPVTASSCQISQNSAFTAVFVLNQFVPGSYSEQKLLWKTAEGASSVFPKGTSITMMDLEKTETSSKVTGYWHYQAGQDEKEVKLDAFRRMGGTESYSYDKNTTESQTRSCMFVVNFEEANIPKGTYKLDFTGTETSGDKTLAEVEVELTGATGYSYTVGNANGLQQAVSYTVTKAAGNDSSIENQALSLVLSQAQNGSQPVLPSDAYIQVGEVRYDQNLDGEYIIPLESTVQTGEKTLTLVSDMFSDQPVTYQMSGQMYISGQSESPKRGIKAGAENTLFFTTEAVEHPAISVSGTRVATVAEWRQGQNLTMQLKNLADQNRLTVQVYQGTTTTSVTDLLASVSGVFDFNAGIGTYNSQKTQDGRLRLSQAASPGLYRLVFTVYDGETVQMEVPYWIIVKE